MEPADQRRDDCYLCERPLPEDRRPQWSPPTSGGTTPGPESQAMVTALPQWSPPTSGGTTTRGRDVLHRPAAAMELADQRRDDPASRFGGTGSTKSPQWSSPTSGGTTAMRFPIGLSSMAPPQRSPPTSGGTTHNTRPGPGSARPAAMEPVNQRRDDRRVRCRHEPGGPAAMEPADQRRDDNSPPLRAIVGSGCRNGARRPAAGRQAVSGATAARPPCGRSGARRPAAGRPFRLRGSSRFRAVVPQWSPPTSGGTTRLEL